MSIRTFQFQSPRRSKRELRIGVVRYLPRGVKKKDYSRLDYFDVWLPVLAPSRALMRWAKPRDWEDPTTRKTFFARYRHELLRSTDARQAIQLLVQVGRSTPISVGCYCQNEKFCHRSVLLKLIRRATKSKNG